MSLDPENIRLGEEIEKAVAKGDESELDTIFSRIYRAKSQYAYPVPNDAEDVSAITKKNGTNIQVVLMHENDAADSKISWHKRYSTRCNPKDPAKMRISLNVHPSKELIAELDAFCDKYGFSYKIPARLTAGEEPGEQVAWYNRHDSVIVFFPDDPTATQRRELSGMAKVRARSNEGLLGKPVTEGIDGAYIVREPTLADVNALRAEALGQNDRFGKWVEHQGIERKENYGDLFDVSESFSGEAEANERPIISPGGAAAIKTMIKAYEEYRDYCKSLGEPGSFVSSGAPELKR